jgi:hypothetical protein
VARLTADERRRLLAFMTGSDRVPMDGLGEMRVMIQKNGADANRFVTSATCFNLLLLPDYNDEGDVAAQLCVLQQSIVKDLECNRIMSNSVFGIDHNFATVAGFFTSEITGLVERATDIVVKGQSTHARQPCLHMLVNREKSYSLRPRSAKRENLIKLRSTR